MDLVHPKRDAGGPEPGFHSHFPLPRAKEQTVRYSHAFRNCLTPLVTLAGLSLPDLFGGALITETVFGYPGMGLSDCQRHYAK